MGRAMKYFLKKLLVQETFKKFMKNFEKFVKPSGPPSYILNVHSLTSSKELHHTFLIGQLNTFPSIVEEATKSSEFFNIAPKRKF